MKPLVLMALLATPAWAQQAAPGLSATPGLSADEFDAYVTGKTLTWSLDAQTWGIEEYLPGRKVQWASQPQECQIGHWYAHLDQICFVYEGNDKPACWIFRLGPNGLSADLQGLNGPLLLTETYQTDKGLACPGPEVGV